MNLSRTTTFATSGIFALAGAASTAPAAKRRSAITYKKVCLLGLPVMMLTVGESASAALVSDVQLDANSNLVSVDVDRQNDGNPQTLTTADLINVSLIELNTGAQFVGSVPNGVAWPGGGAAGAGDARDAILEDFNVASSAINIDSRAAAGEEHGIAVQFNRAVVNEPGIDILLFDPADADTFAWSTSSFIGMPASSTATVQRFVSTGFIDTTLTVDLDLWDPGFDTLSAYRNGAVAYDRNSNGRKLFVAGLDLSSVGIADGASVTTLYINGNGTLDPSLVVGLIPEPASLSLMGLGAIALLRRRRNGYCLPA